MRFQLDKDSRTPIYDQVREQLISALHVGRVHAGSKLPSVRHFARVHSVNPKTIHRIYRRLHEEGYLQLRPGSGAYIASVQRGDLDGDRLLSLHRFFRTALEECRRIGLEPERACALFERFVRRGSLAEARVALVECSQEHAQLFAEEIRRALGTQVVPLRLDDLRRRSAVGLASVDLFVTTESHLQAVEAAAAEFERPILQVRVQPDFIPAIAAAAERGRLLMVVSSVRGLDAFIDGLRGLGLGRAASERIQLAGADDPVRLRQAAAQADCIYVSPLAREIAERYLPKGTRRLQIEQHLSRESLDLLEAAILFGGGAGNGD